MDKDAKILVAGAAGMVGSAIVRKLRAMDHTNLVLTYRKLKPLVTDLEYGHGQGALATPNLIQVDLTDPAAVERCFDAIKPRYILLTAARVGGIQANFRYPAQFIHDNLSIQTHVIHAAHRFGVERLLFLGSSCIYPKQAPQPMCEAHLLSGQLEPTNEPYAVAKIAGLKMCEAYNRQYGTQFVALMPTNLYGPNDNFDLAHSHVLPALIRKCHEAKLSGAPTVVVWGTGTPRREFLHVDDLAEACVHVMNLNQNILSETFLNYPTPCFANVGVGMDCSIRELAAKVREVVGYRGEIVFDTSKPDGAPQKLLEVSRMSSLGWQARIGLTEGLRYTYRWYLDHIA